MRANTVLWSAMQQYCMQLTQLLHWPAPCVNCPHLNLFTVANSHGSWLMCTDYHMVCITETAVDQQYLILGICCVCVGGGGGQPEQATDYISAETLDHPSCGTLICTMNFYALYATTDAYHAPCNQGLLVCPCTHDAF